MKCPKCHYLSFDPEPRCRNCGYDLELSDDLVLKTVEREIEGPLADLTLRDPDPPRRAPITLELVHPARTVSVEERSSAGGVAVAAREAAAFVDAPPPSPTSVPPPPAVAHAPQSASSPEVTSDAPSVAGRSDAPPRKPSTTSELPLFVKGIVAPDAGDDGPMVVVPPVPRPPLAVRRAAPDPPRRRITPQHRPPGPFDRDLLEDLRRLELEHADQSEDDAAAPPSPAEAAYVAQATHEAVHTAIAAPRATVASPARDGDDAPVLMRLGAAAIDGGVLGGIGLALLLLTLRVCGLTTNQIGELPMLPIAAFLLIVAVGYEVLFTVAAGQTPGKMALGLRVASAPGEMLSIRQAAWRAVLSLPSVLVLGAGYLPALVGRQALHDRMAETRVVRA